MRTRLTRCLLIGLLAFGLAAGCDHRVQENEEQDWAMRAALEMTPLASSAQVKLPRPGAAIRVWVNRSEIGCDAAALWVGLNTEQLDALAKDGLTRTPPGPALPLAASRIPLEALRRPGGYLITPLFDQLERARKRAIQISTVGGKQFHPEVVLWVEDIVPFATLSRVLYTLGQAQFPHFNFAVQTPAGVRVLRVDVPQICAGANGTGHGCEQSEPRQCSGLSVSIASSGIVWREREQFEGGMRGILGKIDRPQGASLDLLGKQKAGTKGVGLLDALNDGNGLDFKGIKGIDLDKGRTPSAGPVVEPAPSEPNCHQLPRIGAHLNLPAFRTRLQARKLLLPACKTIVLSASEGVKWQELVATADVLAEVGYLHLQFAVALGDDSCQP